MYATLENLVPRLTFFNVITRIHFFPLSLSLSMSLTLDANPFSPFFPFFCPAKLEIWSRFKTYDVISKDTIRKIRAMIRIFSFLKWLGLIFKIGTLEEFKLCYKLYYEILFLFCTFRVRKSRNFPLVRYSTR